MQVEATAAEIGRRVDVWLSTRLPDLSRSRVQQLIREGHIQCAGRPLCPHTRVRADMVVTVRIPEPEPVSLEPEDIPLQILHEDHDVIVLSKQANLVVHPAPGNPSGTLVNALLFHCKDLAGIGHG